MPGERYYYLKRAVGEKQFKLVMRQGLAGAEKVLVDPEVDARTHRRAARHQLLPPSWDGRTWLTACRPAARSRPTCTC
jgi:prolyl oligopeptidase